MQVVGLFPRRSVINLCLLWWNKGLTWKLDIDKTILVFLCFTVCWRHSHPQYSSAFPSVTWCKRTPLPQIQGTPVSQRTTLPGHTSYSPPPCRILTDVLQPCRGQPQTTCFISRRRSAILVWTQRSRPDLVSAEDSRKLRSCKQWRFPKGSSAVLGGHPTRSVQPHPLHQQVSSVLQTEAVPQESRRCKASNAAQPKVGKGKLHEIMCITLNDAHLSQML
jgi:hypothetical protein